MIKFLICSIIIEYSTLREFPLPKGMIQNVHLWSHPFCIWTKALILSFTLSITGDCAFLSSKISETATIFLFSKFSDNSLYILLSSFSRLPIRVLISSISLNSSLCIWAAQPVNTILFLGSSFLSLRIVPFKSLTVLLVTAQPVSYTHLTLPTNREV